MTSDTWCVSQPNYIVIFKLPRVTLSHFLHEDSKVSSHGGVTLIRQGPCVWLILMTIWPWKLSHLPLQLPFLLAIILKDSRRKSFEFLPAPNSFPHSRSSGILSMINGGKLALMSPRLFSAKRHSVKKFQAEYLPEKSSPCSLADFFFCPDVK